MTEPKTTPKGICLKCFNKTRLTPCPACNPPQEMKNKPEWLDKFWAWAEKEFS